VAAAKRAAVAGVAELNDDAKGMDKNLDLDCAGNRRAAGGLRKAGLPGPYRVAEIDRCGRGKKALQIIAVNPPVPALIFGAVRGGTFRGPYHPTRQTEVGNVFPSAPQTDATMSGKYL
jgi:hypothetical protein